jgi:L-lactate dehydrogenase complex protein LldE
MRVSLFATCLGDQFFADECADAVRLLRALDVAVDFPPDQTCCGQPAFNAGYHEEARAMARHTLRVFRDSEFVVLPSGSCTTMLRAFSPGLFPEGSEDAVAAADLAERTYELSEFIVRVLRVDDLGNGLTDRRVAYHFGCHALRELNLRIEPIALLRNAGAEIVAWEASEECCGFGGLFAVKLPEVSVAMADRKIDTLSGGDLDYVTSTDGGCLLHLTGRMQHRKVSIPVRHLASVLWEACGGNP